MAKIDSTFDHAFTFENLIETPGNYQLHYYFPGATTEGGRDGLLVSVHPEKGQPWIGTFAFGQVSPRGVSGIFTMPNPQWLCVVSKGAGYIVNTNSPAESAKIHATPVLDVRPIRARGIIVFADYTTLIAYDQDGVKWKTKRLTWDSLKITEVTDSIIKGEFWDLRSDSNATFTVDLASGMHEGGIKEI